MSQSSIHSPTQPQPDLESQLQPPPPPPPPQPQPDLESQPQPPPTTQPQPPPTTQPQPPQPDLESQPQPPPPPQQNLQWQDLIKLFLPSAVAIAIQSTQTQLPVSFHLLSLTVILSFSTLFVANLISSKSEDQAKELAKELEKAACFFLIAAFFLAISIAMPVSLKFFSWIMYGVLLFTAYKFR